MTRGTPVEVVSNSYDAFQRLRVSSPYTLLDSKLIFDSSSSGLWDGREVSGSGTFANYNIHQASVTLSVSPFTSGHYVRQTFQRCVYQPGKSQLIMLTCNFHDLPVGITKRVGYFDQKNGVFFEGTNGNLYCCVRSYTSGTPVDTKIPQHEWNACRMNSDDSEFDLNIHCANIFFISFEWLGVGNIFFGMVLNGKYVLLHQIKNANAVDKVYMSTPNLPLRSEIMNDGTGPSSSFTLICGQVSSEGGIDPSGILRSINRGTSALTISTANVIYPLLVIRLKTSRIGSHVYPINMNVVCTSSCYCLWKLIKNPTITGTSLVFTDIPSYSFEFCNTSTNSTSIVENTGELLISGYAAIDASGGIDIPDIDNKLILGTSIDDISDVFVFAITKIGKNGTSDSFYGAMTLRDIM